MREVTITDYDFSFSNSIQFFKKTKTKTKKWRSDPAIIELNKFAYNAVYDELCFINQTYFDCQKHTKVESLRNRNASWSQQLRFISTFHITHALTDTAYDR